MTRRAFAWALYDWANSAFPTVVSTFVIAAYFTQGIAPDPVTGQAQWGWMQTLAGLTIAILAPILGAVADAGGRRRLMLLWCTVICAVATAALWFARPEPGFALFALAAVGLATIAFEIGTVFYNSMLPQVASPTETGRVSGLAWGLGYAGGLCCLALCLALVLPEKAPFGLDRAASEPVRAAALIVAVWMLGFGWPVLFALPDPPPRDRPGWAIAARAGLAEVWALVRSLPSSPALARFMIARLFYTDGLNTLFAFGAIFVAGVYGLSFVEIMVFGIALNVTAGLGAAGFGLIEDRIGSRTTILVALSGVALFGTGLLLASGTLAFWLLALPLGIFVGPAQAASRSLMVRMAPSDQVSTHFGLFALSGRVTGFLGPAALAMVTEITSSQCAGMATVIVFLVVGGAILAGMRET
ncbi:MAG: transporter [Rhodospirillales bacterium]|nr:transporter [Rhodospirillales bacterium]